MSTETDLDQLFANIFEAESQLRGLRERITQEKPDRVFAAIAQHLQTARAEKDPETAELHLECLSLLLGDQGGSRAIDLLIEVLSFDAPGAREAAAEQLQQLATSRFRDFSKGVERALDRLPVGSPALVELPFVLGELPDDGVVALLRRFLKHEDPSAVAAAVEVTADLGEPSLLDALEALRRDRRRISVIGDNDQPADITLGELVEDALQAFAEEEEPPFQDDPHKS